MGLAQRICIATLLLLLAGCSALQFTYNQADTLIAWRADSYFDFDPQQKHDFHRRLDRLLAWHRREQLPDYANFVHAAVARARHGLTRADIVWFIDGFRLRYRAIVDRGTSDAADVLAKLGNEQLRALTKQWAKDNQRFAEERDLNAGIDRQKRARLKRTLQQITDWAGTLTRAQEQHIEKLLEAVPLIEHLRHLDRQRRQQEFLELLKLRTQRQEFQPRLHAWLLDWERGRAPEYERLSAEVFEKRIEFYLAVEKILTAEQRERAVRRLHGFGDDFKTLSERPAAAAAIATMALLP
jgi:hypothetical protein